MRSRKLDWKAGSCLRCSTWLAIAARMISETGRFSTVATVSNSSACSSDRRMVIALGLFIAVILVGDTLVVKRRGILVSCNRDFMRRSTWLPKM